VTKAIKVAKQLVKPMEAARLSMEAARAAKFSVS
jgi:hypothetical protein